MRKDYISVQTDDGRDEARFIAEHWAEIWRTEGGAENSSADVTRSEEYREIAGILDALPPGARIIDAGCGLGAWTRHLGTRGFDPIGLDIAKPTVAELNRIFGEGRFLAADIRATGLPDESVDFYFSWGVFEHFEDGQQACMREAYRLLKPGARMAISVPFDNLRHALSGLRFRGAEIPAKPMRFYQWRLTRQELARELAIAGFVTERIVPIAKISGLQRALTRLGRLAPPIARLIAPIVPAATCAHMLLAVCRKAG